MEKPDFSENFKRDTLHQITVRRYAVREVSERLLGARFDSHQPYGGHTVRLSLGRSWPTSL